MRTRTSIHRRLPGLRFIALIAFLSTLSTHGWACPGPQGTNSPPAGSAINNAPAGSLGKCICDLIDCGTEFLGPALTNAVKRGKAAGCVRIGDSAAITATHFIDAVQECIDSRGDLRGLPPQDVAKIIEDCKASTKAIQGEHAAGITTHTSPCIMFNSDKLKHPDPKGEEGYKKSVVFEEMLHWEQDHGPCPVPVTPGSGNDAASLNSLREIYKELEALMALITLWRAHWPSQTHTIQVMYAYLDSQIMKFCEGMRTRKWNDELDRDPNKETGKVLLKFYVCKNTAWNAIIDGVEVGLYEAPGKIPDSPTAPNNPPTPRSGDETKKKTWEGDLKKEGYDVHGEDD